MRCQILKTRQETSRRKGKTHHDSLDLVDVNVLGNELVGLRKSELLETDSLGSLWIEKKVNKVSSLRLDGTERRMGRDSRPPRTPPRTSPP